jgi:hypothetical protein
VAPVFLCGLSLYLGALCVTSAFSCVLCGKMLFFS